MYGTVNEAHSQRLACHVMSYNLLCLAELPSSNCLVLPCHEFLALSCHGLSCLALSCPVLSFCALSCHALHCLALSFHALSCHALSCIALPCLALSCDAYTCLVLPNCFPLLALSCPALSCVVVYDRIWRPLSLDFIRSIRCLSVSASVFVRPSVCVSACLCMSISTDMHSTYAVAAAAAFGRSDCHSRWTIALEDAAAVDPSLPRSLNTNYVRRTLLCILYTPTLHPPLPPLPHAFPFFPILLIPFLFLLLISVFPFYSSSSSSSSSSSVSSSCLLFSSYHLPLSLNPLQLCPLILPLLLSPLPPIVFSVSQLYPNALPPVFPFLLLPPPLPSFSSSCYSSIFASSSDPFLLY